VILVNSLNIATPHVFNWKDTIDTGAEGWVVIDSLVNGLSAGGLFIHSNATLEEVSDLAKTMSYKNTLLEPILGGAKAGIRFDHHDPRALGVIRRFLIDHKFLLESCWFTGADLNTSNDFIFDVIERDLLFPSAFYSLAKMLNERFSTPNQSASLRKRLSSRVGECFSLETCCTGYSVAMAIKLLVPTIKPRILIQGFGAVGRSLSYFLNLHQIATIVGIADVDGFIYHPEGISIDSLRADNLSERGLALKESYKAKYNWTARLEHENDEAFLCRFLACQTAEIFSPCATRYQITEKVSDTLQDKTFCEAKYRFVVSGANNVFRFETVRIRLEKGGVQVLPEWVSNSGNTILFMESMKERPSHQDWNEHVLGVIDKQLRAFIDAEIAESNAKANNLYENCSRLAIRRLKNVIDKEKQITEDKVIA
jgi:glutamate dehydrogenase (NAD(P)+)